MIDYVSLAIVGALISVVVQFVKSSTTGHALYTRLLVIGLSVVAGGVYYFFRDTSAWKDGLEILLVANTVYLFLIKPFEA